MGRHHKDRELYWLQQHSKSLNLKLIAERVGFSQSHFNKWVKGLPDSKGSKVNLPDRCREPLKSWIVEHINY